MAVTYITEEDTPRTNLKWELADIFREFGAGYHRTNRMPLSHIKVMHAVEVCRTSYLGGHMKVCSFCGYSRPTYNCIFL
jgi:hypothetical protein